MNATKLHKNKRINTIGGNHPTIDSFFTKKIQRSKYKSAPKKISTASTVDIINTAAASYLFQIGLINNHKEQYPNSWNDIRTARY